MPFAFRHQPLRTMFILGGVIYILVSLPVWLVLAAIPATRPRRSWSFKRAIFVRLLRPLLKIRYQTALPTPTPLTKFESDAKALGFVWVKATPDLVVGEIRELAEKNGVKAERVGGFWYGPRGPDGEVGQPASPGEKVVYHMHGGGHVLGSANPKTEAKTLAQGYLDHLGPKVRVFAIEYRLSSAPPFQPANPFPASLIDAISGYRYLIEDVGFDPGSIVLSGDSAGGGIAFNLARYLVAAHLPSLPKPGGIILSSPTVDWAQTHVGPKSSMVRNSQSDFVHAVLESGYPRRALVGRFPEEWAAQSAWISPGALNADWQPGMFSGFPRTVVLAGGAEYTLDGIHTLYERLVQDNGKDQIMLIEPPDATHDVLVLEMYEPERTEVLQQLGTWVRTL
ncbi:alpha/beta-hydrolase [Panus rudis PR-1116 ss-1]|nr:alpha/beta-hydrolase [Panus rudis PR-1116 ss-1]